MRSTLLYILCFFALTAMGQKHLTVLHTNDTHSCVMPLNPNLADTAIADRGGYLRRINMIKQERQSDPQLLLLDSGDFSQGSPYYSLFKGDVEVGLMNQMKYDAATIGNHEFDFGLENMARIFRLAKFPIVCSNYDFTGTPVEGTVKRYITLKRKGVKIGIFGICTQLEGLVTKANCEGVKFLDPVKTAQEMADLLRNKEKCDVVICLSHLGWDIDGCDDTELVPSTRNIDLVLGAHSHTYFHKLEQLPNLDGKLIGIDQNGKSAIWVGKLVLDINARK
jgi:5'-nucleotidase